MGSRLGRIRHVQERRWPQSSAGPRTPSSAAPTISPASEVTTASRAASPSAITIVSPLHRPHARRREQSPCPEFVRYFGNSSGSSNHGRPKFLPITDRQIRLQRRAGADTLMRYLPLVERRPDPLRLHPRPLSAHHDALGRARPRDVHPALMMSQMPVLTRPCTCRERRAHDRQLRREASGHRRAIHRPRRARPGGNDVLVHALFEKVPGRGARTRSAGDDRVRGVAESAGALGRSVAAPTSDTVVAGRPSARAAARTFRREA